ncbi:alpha/beta hydrolase [Arthrobacter crystallopoietes]|uniref:alpha/beta hydrolase n=1 Tax=Crystallibacter crystallopoietes TaxID=37928 RepID=UPI001F1157CF|nr:alpha/beta hydrolase [Arthrobacter crystallopoietes]
MHGRYQAKPQRLAYGPHPDQWGELYFPDRESPRGIVVVIHGGYWRDKYTAQLGAPIAKDLVCGGFAVWNLEYRRAGTGGKIGAGGWPGTFEDIAAGIDHLADLDRTYKLDLNRVSVLGHSAGGHLAVWAAGRHSLPSDAPGAVPKVRLVGAVSQSGLLDLAAAEKLALSEGAVVNLMGGTSDEIPPAFDVADPLKALPIGVPVFAVHSREDADVPFEQSANYAHIALAAGDPVELHEVTGDHFDIINPSHEAYRRCRDLLERLLPNIS